MLATITQSEPQDASHQWLAHKAGPPKDSSSNHVLQGQA